MSENEIQISTKDKVLYAAARLFLEKGYKKTTIRDIADFAGVNRGSVTFAFEAKETILLPLVKFVLEGQFARAKKIISEKTNDPVLYYAVETVMQLHMAESSEQIRELYAASYALPETSALIYQLVTSKLNDIFSVYNPTWEEKDFYEREIATAGIIRGYMSIPCDIYFTMDRKIKAFLETALIIYNVPKEKINEAIAFMDNFDFEQISKDTVAFLLNYLEEKTR